jgi:hypothetical protein
MWTGHCSNAATAERLFSRMHGILKIFSEKLRLFYSDGFLKDLDSFLRHIQRN